ncbi:hypothetical protein [Rhodococcus sp. JG-3]|uniref:hypothetical protein n=1 Tax=Rhodococcus sp. JG-3 TaxID=1305835 RepID=UPI00042665F5|nr:hypothetical protein [Rhodococcus sp. JG-3]
MSVKESASVGLWAEQNQYSSTTLYGEDGLGQIAAKTCGLYLLEFADGQAYVGISIDIKARLKQHAVNHPDILTFRVRPMSGTSIELRRVERALVHSAEAAGLTLRNREHASAIVGLSTLDAVVSPDEQAEWSRNPLAVNRQDVSLGVEYSDSQLAAHAGTYARLQAHPRYADIVRALGTYLNACVPFPSRTEGTFWTVSCFPGSSKTLILRVSMSMLETFFIWEDPETGMLQVRFFVNGTYLPKARRLSLPKLWRKLSKHVKAGPIGHKSAGAFERTVVVDDIDYIDEAFRIPGVALAAGSHVMAVMRKRQSGYKSSHNPHLAAAAVAVFGSHIAEFAPAAETAGTEKPEPTLHTLPDPSIKPADSEVASEKVRAFHSADGSGEVGRFLAALIDVALPDYREDVGLNWGLTCMPRTNAGAGRKRLFTLNIGQIEVAYAIKSTRSDESALIGVVVVSASELETRTGKSLADLSETYTLLGFHQHGYVAAKGDDVSIAWGFEAEALAQLHQLPWKEASAVLADALRTSLCPYSKFHSEAMLTALTS